MNKHLIAGAALALGTGLACAEWSGPFEGGQAAEAWRPPAAPAGAPGADRAAVKAEARETARHVDSRAGYQSDAERLPGPAPMPGGRTRAEVREEARAGRHELTARVYEGGPASNP